jgi:hypothetical protein
MQFEEQGIPIIWSAATCDFRGAGVYVGLAPEGEHIVVARGVGAKQMQAYVGGQMRQRGETRPWPIHYYAVRDPQAIRVIPVHQPALPNGFKPVQLRFRFPPHNGRNATILTPSSLRPIDHTPAGPIAGFVITVGLQMDKELEFFQRTIENHLDQDWDEVFRRVAAYGCKGAA